MQKRYGWKIIKKSLKTFLVTEHFFGLNIIIKPMKIINNKYVKGYSESFKCQLFNGANRFWKLFMSTEIYVKNKSWKNHRKFPFWVTFRIITFFAQVIEIDKLYHGKLKKFPFQRYNLSIYTIHYEVRPILAIFLLCYSITIIIYLLVQ